MITKRIIPCLDVRGGRVVKGVNFEGVRDVSSPVELGKFYSDSGADELVFYDITASVEGRALFTDILREVASTIFIPLTVGGGINTIEDFDRVLKCGADKVSVNSGAIRNPSLVGEAAKRYGDQCVVLSADIKRVNGVFHVFAKGGREDTGMEAIEWVKRCVDNGAGEIVVIPDLLEILGEIVEKIHGIVSLLESDICVVVIAVLGIDYILNFVSVIGDVLLMISLIIIDTYSIIQSIEENILVIDYLKS